jgi:hypothetical protein
MKRFWGILFVMLAAMAALDVDAQQFTNDWIDFGQDYYRLAIPQTGVYRVSRSQLEAAGVPVGSFNPQNIQLFQNGKPVACRVASEHQGLLDYIEFFAEGNNGWFDVEMYDKPESQTNPYYSLITDTAAVFLTWNNRFNNLRHLDCSSQSAEDHDKAQYCIIDTLCQYTATYVSGEESCEYTEAEGWFDGSAVSLGKQLTKTVPTPKVFAGNGLKAKISLALATYSSLGHHITVTGPGVSVDTTFYGLRTIKYQSVTEAADLLQQNKYVFASINDIKAKTDYSRVSFIEIEYPSAFDFKGRGQQIFRLPPATADSSITITNMELAEDAVLYDVTRNLHIGLVVANGEATAVVPAHADTVKLVVARGKALRKVGSITHTPFVNHAVSGKQVLMLSQKTLIDGAREYANYRDAYLVDVEELYNQFGYGIRKHPMAIRHFIEYVVATWKVRPQYLFIVGKGVAASDMRKNATAYANCLVPTVGVPASDALLSAYVAGSGTAPLLATGRLSALNATDIDNYLNKVKAFEQNPQSEWMKRVLHFVGGKTQAEQREIRRYMSDYKSIIEDTLFGASVTSFYKSTSDPISTSKNDSVKMLINSGVSMMTFFGHGSGYGGFDQDIDVPTYYNNTGKYPLILSNSCYTGNIYGTWQSSVSESWVLATNRGAIGLIAMVNEGVPYYLNQFTSRFYRLIANQLYAEPIGKAMRTAQVGMSGSSNRLTICTIQEMVLHGDPCIVLNSSAQPDLQIKPSDVWFTPSVLTTAIDSFTVNVALRNVGRAITTGFVVELNRTLPDGSTTLYAQQLDRLVFKDTLRFRLPMNRISAAGANQFTIKLDAMEQIAELSEDNNAVSVSAFVQSVDVTPVWPYNYGLVDNVPAALKASSSDVVATAQKSVFQIDTTERFNSARMRSESIEHGSGVVEWHPSAAIDTGQVYFWRAKSDAGTDFSATSSFVARKGLTGWEQSVFEQIDDNDFVHIKADAENQSFGFASAARTLRCHNIGSPNSSNFMKISFEMDGFSGQSSCGANNALLMVVVDSFSLVPWQSDRGRYGHSNYPHCSSAAYEQYFIFYLSNLDAGLDSLISMVENHVPNGNYIMIYSFMSGRFQQWPEKAYDAFEQWGATKIRTVNSLVPYIFFTQKGHPDEAEEVIGTSSTDQIDFHRTLYNNFNFGTITSPTIGPAQRWAGLEWQGDIVAGGESFVRVLGVEADGATRVLKDSVDGPSAILTDIDVNKFNRLKLQFFSRNDSSRVPSQLKMWRVLYTPYTDLAVNPARGWLFLSDTLHEGEKAVAAVAYENIGQQQSDSILVRYWLQTITNRIVEIGTKRLKALAPGEYVIDTVEFETVGLDAENVFYAELNPMVESRGTYDQMEQTHFNNFIQKPFCILRDSANPLLDVTFDGRHIADGEIVSAQPVIAVTIADANRYMVIDDTNSVSIYLTPLATGIERRIDLGGNSNVSFESGTPASNIARLELSMPFESGVYQLRVRAHDASGNESGNDDYIISFRVIEENSVSEVYAYPNPFSSSVRFGFDLTGDVLPDNLRIDIYNSMGKIVKTLTMADFGSLHFGLNLSSVWNGTGANGAFLPAGVYFYKAHISYDGIEFPTRNFTGRASSLVNGVGRLIIIR